MNGAMSRILCAALFGHDAVLDNLGVRTVVSMYGMFIDY